MVDFIYRCAYCGREWPGQEERYTCPHDGHNLDVVLDYAGIQAQGLTPGQLAQGEASLWRYLPLLPIPDPGGHGTPLRRVGWTPLEAAPGLRHALGMTRLWVKDESPNPTASFKDRASAVVLARARQQGARVVVTASTGNAGAALAGLAAALGQTAVIFAPATAPRPKVAQLLLYGARVVLVQGTYDQAYELSLQAAQAWGWYCRNTGYNPFTTEGKKTAAYELWEQLPQEVWQDPRRVAVFIPVGDGNIISGMYKGFWDLHQLGWLEELPRLFGVQAQGSAAIARAFEAGTWAITPVQARTVADSLAVDLPRDGYRALRAVRATGGRYITVRDDEILRAMALLGRLGWFVEPAAATALAGLQWALAQGLVSPDTPTVLLLTGSGLKDPEAALRAAPQAPVVEPSLTAVAQTLKDVLT